MKAFKPADILIPRNVDLTKWSVIACDQYTSEPKYWESVRNIVGSSPSALNIIFPEVYLGDDDGDERIRNIHRTMKRYLAEGVFRELRNSFIYTERVQSNGKTRRGIVGQLDLEEYDFSKRSQSLIRATEGTIIERIPPRQRVRRGAPLETTHIIMLIDDRDRTVAEPLSNCKDSFEKLYDFDLMKGAGHITGYRVSDAEKNRIMSALDKLADKDAFDKKYGVHDKGALLFAAGDGNHSLATAKMCWEDIKKTLSPSERENHPARYALAELMNIHDDALDFEPIQRVIFDVDPKKMLDGFVSRSNASFTDNGGQRIDYAYQGIEGSIYITDASSNLPVGTLQNFLDKYLAENGGRIDYIHGNDVVRNLTAAENTIGFMVDKMKKSDLFATVIKDGSLPRKTFSMGEAADKRFYLECKKI